MSTDSKRNRKAHIMYPVNTSTKYQKEPMTPGTTYPAYTAMIRMAWRVHFHGVTLDRIGVYQMIWYAGLVAERYQRMFHGNG